jgi:acetyl-CoA carboxylase biotin carboxylase subunit
MAMFKKILIANRGEIALRIMSACRELGIKTVAVYSQADKYCLHTRFADEAICIGPAQSAGSYLNIPHIISAADITNADAIHPGYGFLAENPEFVEICQSCNIAFIGPSPKTMRLSGDKSLARKQMMTCGIPVTSGSEENVDSFQEAKAIAKKIGYPVLLKASAGGGGKGMRIIRSEDKLEDNLKLAQLEAEISFGNNNIYVEKYIENPRHIEFQIIGDTYGNIIHLGERECSIQRRHQKLIEECPSTVLTDDLRAEMAEAAISIARETEYYNAGTIEFLLDEDKKFYFMEINARIQVEHPVTEMVWGLDLIKEQIRVAAGRKLKFSQKHLKPQGHSIECRINTENPETMVPSSGTITTFIPPNGLGVRLDTAAYQGYEVTPFYDSLLAKLIIKGNNRKESLQKLNRSLDFFIIEGVNTNITLHSKIINHPDFIAGNFGTQFLEKLNI